MKVNSLPVNVHMHPLCREVDAMTSGAHQSLQKPKFAFILEFGNSSMAWSNLQICQIKLEIWIFISNLPILE